MSHSLFSAVVAEVLGRPEFRSLQDYEAGRPWDQSLPLTLTYSVGAVRMG